MKTLYVIALAVALSGGIYGIVSNPTKAVNGTILYAISPDGDIYKIDATTCEVCPILNPTGISNGTFDLVILPNGNILVQTFDGLRLYDPPDPDPIWSNSTTYGGAILAPDGLVYLTSPDDGSGSGGLSVYDPATNDVTFIGNWPPNIIANEFFYQNGVLYALAVEGPPPFMWRIIEVNLSNPDQSTIAVMNPPSAANGGTTNDGYTTAMGGNTGKILSQYDVATNSFTTVCTLLVGMSGLTDLPPGVEESPCVCLTAAGTVGT